MHVTGGGVCLVLMPTGGTCNQDMWLIRAEPHAVLAAYDVWSFECPGCKATKQLTVDRWSKTPPP
jgi:hypothetical protein